ncbi:AAA family ATPase [Actinotalea subterranea]|uniref:AAA family ATPase n=1 Tax=Actinotalea subterranea TaxID=2607497 RepID=UPI0011EEBC11|nr:SMC family ATPase [Actinotalea subterranea]
MHLHTMTLQALGPFAGTHTIDFAELGASGIFLLEGPTGAGKSTIIDAIVFALYGKVASAEASEDRLRSAHAAPETETFVDLVLESGSGIYRIRRTPRFERPKRSGSGTTTQQPGAKLWRLTDVDRPDEGELLATRLDDVGVEVQRIVGLDRAQFVQTVVLPQGEFASFLRAKPEDRRGLLQKVFGTEVYEAISVRLDRMRAEATRQVEAARQAVGRSAAGFVGAAALADEDAQAVRDAAEGSAAVAALTALVDRLESGIAADVTRASGDAEAVEARRVAARAALDEARALDAALTRRAALVRERAGLDEQGPEHARRVERHDRARRARTVLPWVQGAEQAAGVADAATQTVRRLRDDVVPDLRDLVDESTELGVQRKTLAVERDRCTAVRATLDRLVELEGGLTVRRSVLEEARAQRTRLTTERDRAVAERTRRPEERATLVGDLDAARSVAAGRPAAEQRAAAGSARLEAAVDVDALVAELARVDVEVQGAATDARHAIAEAANVQQARIRGIAGELAESLVDGEPCMVCGGIDHPHVATRVPGDVTVEDVEAAEARRSTAQDALTDVTARRGALRERMEARRAAAEGTDVTTATAMLEAARAEVAACTEAAVHQAELEAALVAFDAATEQIDAQVAALGAEIAAVDARLADLAAGLQRDEAEVDAARDGAATVQERARALDDRARQVSAWSDALATLEDARATSAARSEELADALREHGFRDVAEVHAAHLPDRELDAVERAIKDHEAAVARVDGGLAEPELARLPAGMTVDVAAAASACATAEDEAARVAGEVARLRQTAAAAHTARTDVERAVSELVRAERDAAPVTRMANLAGAVGGDNTRRLSLATYVLTRRFEDVVAAANARLTAMSAGRFELVRSDEREDVGSRKTGLAMKVVDHHTETLRDPRTLSGGETFYVSLCLALGLADVVTAEAGGIDLGTLFVDEGFGSLDTETLDIVLAELGRLRDGGRVVGVVSHVDALKQSIAERIEVRRLEDGSSTLTVRA